MTQSGADYFVEALETYGVEYLFGNPGTTEVPVVEAVEDSDVEYVLGLQEDIAVGMAAGYACTRREHECDRPVGVVNLHVAPGMAHGLGNLYAASVSNAPLVVTAGAHGTGHQHEEPILHGNLVEMTQQFTKWSAEVKHPDALPTMLRRAFKTALTPPTGPVFLSLPIDVMLADAPDDVEPLDSVPSPGRGPQADIDQGVEAVLAADDPVVVVGDQIAWEGEAAVDATVRLAEAAGARVYGEILSASVNFPMDHEQWQGVAPESFADAREMHDTDTVLLLGCSTHTPTLDHDEPLVPRGTTVVDVGVDPWEVGKNTPADVSVVGALAETLDEMARQVEERLPADERERRLDAVRERESEPPADDGASETMSKFELVETVRDTVPDAYLVDESVTTRYALYSTWDLQPKQLFGNKSGGLGYGLPAAVGAAIAENDRDDPRPVVGLVGDGSYLYYPHSLYSAARYGVDLTVVVSNNHNYRILKENTMKILGGTEDDHSFVGMDFVPGVDFVGNARSHRAASSEITTPAELEAELEAAVDAAGPTVLNVDVRD